MRRLLLAWTVAMMAIGLTSTPARADAPRDQGWWAVTNPLPPLPDVPARGLLVQGGGGGAPTAVAAVLYELGPGTSVGNLTLGVAPNSLTTPKATLQLCDRLMPFGAAIALVPKLLKLRLRLDSLKRSKRQPNQCWRRWRGDA